MLTFNDTQTLATATSATAVQQLTNMLLWDATAVITDTTPGAKTFASGVAEVDTFNFPAKASAGDGDYVVQWDVNGLAWAVALDTTGGAANTPTGAVWAAIPAAQKVYLDISATTTAASVATAVKAGFNALSGFSSVVTASDAAADGHLANTAYWPGVVTAPSVHNKGDTGAGSVTVVRTTTGTASAVAPTGNTVTIANHGFTTGLKVINSSSSSLPTGLSGSAEYVIVVDSNTVKFATSQANALAGTAIAITGPGVGTQTVTPQALVGTLVVQKSNDVPAYPGQTQTWFTITTPSSAASQNVSATTLNYYDTAVGYPYMRFLLTITSGAASVALTINGKGQ